MSDFTRRDLMRSSAAAMAVQHVHPPSAAVPQGGAYKPKTLNEHEWKTVARLADLIMPAENGENAGTPEYIDVLCAGSDRMAQIWFSGLAWLDSYCAKAHGAAFVELQPEQQTAVLDLIAYRKNDSAELGPGITFFDWARRMVVDAYFTSPAGVKALGYKGNVGMQKFEVPVEALNYAVRRSGLE